MKKIGGKTIQQQVPTLVWNPGDKKPSCEAISECLKKQKVGCGTHLLLLTVSAALDEFIIHVNPSWKSDQLQWPLSDAAIDDLVSFGLAFSLADAITHTSPTIPQKVFIVYLHELLSRSVAARDQLIRSKKVPLSIGVLLSKEEKHLVACIENLCRDRWKEVEHAEHHGDWTSWPSFYEIWIRQIDLETIKLRIHGAASNLCSMDLGGVHLTGGRIWPASLLLAKLVGFDDRLQMKSHPRNGPILEIGAGIGLSGLILAKLGHKVVLSDREPTLLNRLHDNIETNQVRNKCRVLKLDWADVGESRMRRLLRAQRFSAVIGADLIYDGKEVCELVANVVRHALPLGGMALFVLGKWHRKGSAAFDDYMRKAGFEVSQRAITPTNVMQQVFLSAHERNQEFVEYVVHVPPNEHLLDSSNGNYD
jgi:predicted nicotinamide N-methyase